MKTVDIRNLFLKYFEEKNHSVIDSAPLIPINDPSLLWINAGVVPLKKYFDGSVVPNDKRLVNSQRCIRTNDIENVGYTARHHTYFEMLGNFSIGDYFKKDAIDYAYEFLTSKDWLNFDLDKLYMTYYPEDTETKQYWIDLGVEESHLIPLEGNYWEIGEGPCGPCTEIFYDRGSKYDMRGIELIEEDIENDRYIELWNVVLSQFNSKAELKRSEYPELPNKNIDTGMGLERMACIMQDVETNFDTDIFMVIINKISELSSVKYDGQTAFKVIADHIRTVSLAIMDGALPSNEGRGYVIRRLLRRAIRYGVKLGFNEPFMYKLVTVVNDSLPYYDFTEQLTMIERVIKSEEEKFYNTLESGEHKLAQMLKANKISGSDAFLLYDTFGFPVELTIEVAKEHGITVDINEYNEYLEAQKERSRLSRSDESGLDKQSELLLNLKLESKFVGYDKLQHETEIIAIIQDEEMKTSATGKMGLILKETPFYAESGGQVSDHGYINNYEVTDVIKAPHGQHIHFIESDTTIELGNCKCVVDFDFRASVKVNHSATHLLNYALQSHFGNHVKQQGSYVSDKYFRFDFTHFDTINDDDILCIEKMVNNYLTNWKNIEVNTMQIEEAKAMGATALFGEKYDDVVRVVKLGESLELCGGCHIDSFEELTSFAILSFESKGSGVYRFSATTNEHVEKMLDVELDTIVKENTKQLKKLDESIESLNNEELNYKYSELSTKFEDSIQNFKSYENRLLLNNIKLEIASLKKQVDKFIVEASNKQAVANIDFSSEIVSICDLKVVVTTNSEIDVEASKAVIDSEFERHSLDFILFINSTKNLVFIAKASEKAVELGVHSGNLVKEAAIICGGNGGGRPNFAQAGGKDKSKINVAKDKIITEIKSIC